MAAATTRTVKAGDTVTHSIRAPRSRWARAESRAAKQGVNRNKLVNELLEGYAQGAYILPKRRTEVVRTYPEGSSPEGVVLVEDSGSAA